MKNSNSALLHEKRPALCSMREIHFNVYDFSINLIVPTLIAFYLAFALRNGTSNNIVGFLFSLVSHGIPIAL